MELLRTHVAPDWIDYNGHMNVAYYHMAFDQATDRLLDKVGLGEDYLRRENGSMFALEDRMTYRQEVREGDPIRITFQLVDFDEKRVHYFLRMFHAEEGFLAATCEHLSTFVDMTTRRSALMPKAVHEALARLMTEHARLDRPEEMGRAIGIRR